MVEWVQYEQWKLGIKDVLAGRYYQGDDGSLKQLKKNMSRCRTRSTSYRWEMKSDG